MNYADVTAYWTGYDDALATYGYPLWVAIYDAEPDWLGQDIAMLTALNVD